MGKRYDEIIKLDTHEKAVCTAIKKKFRCKCDPSIGYCECVKEIVTRLFGT